jgi:purine-binding chemotaxis protein CheW
MHDANNTGVPGDADAPAGKQRGTQRYLAFSVGGVDYGIAIENVQELRHHDPLTRLASAPAAIRGVINLRGSIVPIVDPGLFLGSEAIPDGRQSAVIVLRAGSNMIGMVVDRVSDVIAPEAGEVMPPPMLGEHSMRGYITGVTPYNGALLLMIDLSGLLAAAGLAAGIVLTSPVTAHP